MKSLTIKEITSMGQLALTDIIDYWKDYDQKSVLLDYAELKKRNYSFPERLIKRQYEFSTNNNYDKIDTFLDAYLKENGFNSINDLYIHQIESEKVQKKSKPMINPYNIFAAGRSIKNVVYAVLAMTFFVIIAIFIANTSRDLDIIKNVYLFLGMASLFCNVIILLQLYSAGDNLERSVYIEED